MHGADVSNWDEEAEMKEAPVKTTPKEDASFYRGAEKLPMMFGDPEQYKHMNQEEREELTKKMMAAHKGFLQGKGILVPKKPKL